MYDNYYLKDVPSRPEKPRESGVTMVMDKGLSIRQLEDMIEVSGDYIDIVKLGWATSYVYPQLQKKLDLGVVIIVFEILFLDELRLAENFTYSLFSFVR